MMISKFSFGWLHEGAEHTRRGVHPSFTRAARARPPGCPIIQPWPNTESSTSSTA